MSVFGEDRHTEDLGEDLDEGHDPFGDADPGSCHPKPEKCAYEPMVLDSAPETSEVPTMEEMQEPFVMEPQVLIPHPEDGLPVPAGESQALHEAPAFTYEGFVCVEDAREFVEIFHEEYDDYAPGLLRIPWFADALSRRSRYQAGGTDAARKTFSPDRVLSRFGHAVVELTEEEQKSEGLMTRGKILLVRPARPRCKHLSVQVFNHDGVAEGEPGHMVVFRNCMMRRSVGGAFMSLRDQAVYACTFRSPPDPGSIEKHVTVPEKKKLEGSKSRLPMFQKDDSTALPDPGR